MLVFLMQKRPFALVDSSIGTSKATPSSTTISIDTDRRRIIIDYTFHSVHWEPTLTALLIGEGLIKGRQQQYRLILFERSGHRSLDLLAIGRKVQKQLCSLSKHPVCLNLKAAQI